MKKQTRTILQELNSLALNKPYSDLLIETTADNIIKSSINLLNLINETYDAHTANELERRFLNSIKSGDPRKFKRGINSAKANKK